MISLNFLNIIDTQTTKNIWSSDIVKIVNWITIWRKLFKMSVPYSGAISRSGGVISAIVKERKLMTLKPVKRIVIKYDPFHEKAKYIRDFSYLLFHDTVMNTNLNCKSRTEIVNDRSEPTVTFDLNDGQSYLFKAGSLTILEIFQQYNKHITPLAPVEEEVVKEVKIKTKKVGKRR